MERKKQKDKFIKGLVYRRYNVSRIDTFSVRLEESQRGIPHSTTREHSNGQLEFQSLGRYIVKPNCLEDFLNSLKKEEVGNFVYSSDVSKAGAYVCYSGEKHLNKEILGKSNWNYVSTDYEWTRLLESGNIAGGRQ